MDRSHKNANLKKLHTRYFAIKTFLDHFQNTSSSSCQIDQTFSLRSFLHHTREFQVLLCLFAGKCGHCSNLNITHPCIFIFIKDSQENKAFISHRSLALKGRDGFKEQYLFSSITFKEVC